jgi:hypothetical protein
MISNATFDYNNPDFKERRKCSKCGAFLGPAATYCDRCGASASSRGTKFVKWLIILILIIAGFGYFQASDIDPVDWVEQKIDKLFESFESAPEKPQPQKPTTAKPQPQKPIPAKPETKPDVAEPQSQALKLKVGRTYHTQRGYIASLKKEHLMEFYKLNRANNQEALKQIREKRQVGNLKTGLTVELLEINNREDWVKVRIQGKKTTFYTAREALVK